MYKILSVTLVCILFTSCAYYNTFYNAEACYQEALEYANEHPEDPSSHEKDLLDKAIYGAGRVLARYPDSRWVDDAQLLMGDALLLRGQRSLVGSGTSDFTESIQSFASVISTTNNQSFLDRALLGQGRAAIELHRYNEAAASFEEVSRDNERVYSLSRLLLCSSYIEADLPELAANIFDTLSISGDDSLEAEYYITGGSILASLGQPESGAVLCLKAAEIENRGSVYYRALVTASEYYLEAGMPENASAELNTLLLGYRSDREMADISLLKGRADELAGERDAALSAYLNASELDGYRETGAEALYRRAILLEKEERYNDALVALNDCANRAGDFMWLRLAADRQRNLSLYVTYSDSLSSTGGDDKIHYTLLAAEKRLDLYGMDENAIDLFETVSMAEHILFSPMAVVFLADNNIIPCDSVEIVLLSIRNAIPQSDLAGLIEERLNLPEHHLSETRPSRIIEAAWVEIELRNWNEAWNLLDPLLNSPFGYEVRAEALWAAYLSSEAARMEGEIVNGYLRELISDFPETAEGTEAALRRAIIESEDGEEGEGEE